MLRRPALMLHERIDGVRDELNRDIEGLRDNMVHRVARLEVSVIAWGATAALLIVSGLFLLMGLWLGLSALMGPIGASFTLAALFGLLAAVPIVALPRELARVDAAHPTRSKATTT